MVQAVSSMSRNGLEVDELNAIPFENERINVVFPIVILTGKGEKRVTIDVLKGLHIYCSIRLKRLQFDKLLP